jgi:hypothetical protein
MLWFVAIAALTIALAGWWLTGFNPFAYLWELTR